MTSTIPTVIPIRLDCLPLNGIHNLYAVILENPVALFAIEQDPDYKRTPLVHHYIWLYHNYVRARVDLTTTSTLSSIALQRWSNRLAAMRFEILQLLVLVEYGKYIEKCVPAELLQSLLQTTLLLLPDVFQEEYLSNEDGRVFFEHADPTIVPSPSNSINQVDSVPAVPAVPTPAQSPRPIPPPLRRRSGLSSLDFTRLGQVVSSVLSAAANDRPNPDSITSPTPSAGSSHCSPDRARPLRRQTPAHPGNLNHHRCFQCGSRRHFKQDCPLWECPFCHITAPGHLSTACSARPRRVPRHYSSVDSGSTTDVDN